LSEHVRTQDGLRLHAEVVGDGPVGVVLAHGWSGDGRIWGPVVDELAGSLAGRARVVRYDHRGHGRSDPAPPQTMNLDQLADDLAAVVAALAPQGPLVLAGHSMGGMTIMALAERHPAVVERVRGVAMISTASGGLAGHSMGLSPRAARLVRRIEKRLHSSRYWQQRSTIGMPRVVGPVMRWLTLGPGADARARRLTTASISSCRPVTMSGFRQTLDEHERDAALAAFAEIPTVVLVGSRDKLTPVHSARRIVQALPSADLTIYPEAGHMLPVERVDAVAGRLAGLVTRASRDAVDDRAGPAAAS